MGSCFGNKIILDSITGKLIDTGEPSACRVKISENAKQQMRDPKKRKACSEGMKRAWQDPTKRAKMLKSQPEGHRRTWQNPEFRLKMSKIRRELYKDPNFVAKMRESHKIKPNIQELRLQSILNKHFPNTYKYVGDYQVTIGGKCPDFININGKKEVIELFGHFWHKIEEVEAIITHYGNYGFSCIVIWEEEINDEDLLVQHIASGKVYIPNKCHKRYTIFDYRANKSNMTIILDEKSGKLIQVN